MKYAIKTYQEEYLDDHARIEANERNRWDIIIRPDREQLKIELTKKYSHPDFDPETQLYAFKGDEMVGLVTSSTYKEKGVIKGELSIPFVAEGYDDAREPLINQAIEVLKSKGAASIRVMVSEYWGKTVSVAMKNGFRFDKNVVIQAQKRFVELDEKILVEPKDVQNFDYQNHADALTKLLMKQYNVSAEEARPVVDRFKDWKIGTTKNPSGVPQRLVSHGLIIDNEEILGRHLGFQQDLSGEKTIDLSIYAKDNNKELLSQLLAAGIKESKAIGMEVLHIGLREPTDELKEFYSSYGLIFRTAAAYYTKEEGL